MIVRHEFPWSHFYFIYDIRNKLIFLYIKNLQPLNKKNKKNLLLKAIPSSLNFKIHVFWASLKKKSETLKGYKQNN